MIVTDQKGSSKEIAVTVNPYEIKLEDNATSLTVNGFDNSKKWLSPAVTVAINLRR